MFSYILIQGRSCRLSTTNEKKEKFLFLLLCSFVLIRHIIPSFREHSVKIVARFREEIRIYRKGHGVWRMRYLLSEHFAASMASTTMTTSSASRGSAISST